MPSPQTLHSLFCETRHRMDPPPPAAADSVPVSNRGSILLGVSTGFIILSEWEALLP